MISSVAAVRKFAQKQSKGLMGSLIGPSPKPVVKLQALSK